MTKILLVEDQPTAAAYLARGLSEEGMEVDVAHTGPDGLRLLLTVDYDLALLDIMLPELDGWTILERARRARRRTPVLFLTARDAVGDRVRGLELGADDYLAKPFAFGELLARMRAILRRSERQPPAGGGTVYTLADLRVDLAEQSATRGGDRLDLPPKKFALLSLLIARGGEVQSRTLIAELVWKMDVEPGNNIVEAAIRRLRGKLDDPYPVKLLHTVRGVGYVLEAPTPA